MVSRGLTTIDTGQLIKPFFFLYKKIGLFSFSYKNNILGLFLHSTTPQWSGLGLKIFSYKNYKPNLLKFLWYSKPSDWFNCTHIPQISTTKI